MLLEKKIFKCFVVLPIFCILVSCVKSNADKKTFIKKEQQQTNAKVAKKYGELIIPDFVQNYDYQLDNE